MTISISHLRGIAVIKLDNPPVNAISSGSGLVERLALAVAEAEANPDVVGIVIGAEGRFFSAGADIADFGENPADDVGPIRGLIARLDESTKPAVAAMHGIAFGGGLEVALACHYRLCRTGTEFALPEVTLGLLPGGGGSQRLPRLVGAELALDLMLTGRRILAEEALRVGLIDDVATGDLNEAAIAAALALAAGAMPLRRTSALEVAHSEATHAALEDARQRATGAGPLAQAQTAIIACVEAAITCDFAQGLALEHKLFDDLMLSEVSRGLRHAFLIGRKVDKVPGLPAPDPDRRIDRVVIVGGGTMGVGIATTMLAANLSVALVDRSDEVCATARDRIERNLAAMARRGRITSETEAAAFVRLSLHQSIAAAEPADLYLEAVFENLDVKQRIFAEIEAVAPPRAILATNTSTLDVGLIASVVADPGRVLGMHFFSPAHVMALIEIVRAPLTAPQVVADVLALARRLKKVGVVAGVCDGFIGNRIFEEYLRQAYFLLEEGALPAQVDAAMQAWGFAMGPLRVMDLAGQDIGFEIRRRRAVEQPDRPYSSLPDKLVAAGRLGQKTGKGYYDYEDGGRRAVPAAEVEAMVIAHSAEIGLSRRFITDDEIVSRCLSAMVNEGALILEEGIAARPLDIDAVYLHGYGFPQSRGGPMFSADRLGLPVMLDHIRAFAAGYQGWSFRPAPLLERLVREGRGFADLNG